jgi:hypothetical protein
MEMAGIDVTGGNIDALAAHYAELYPTIDPSVAVAMTSAGGDSSIQIPNGGWNAPMANSGAAGQTDWNQMMKLAQAGISPLTPKQVSPLQPSGSVPGGGPQGKTLLQPPGTPTRGPGLSLGELLARIKI